MNKQEKSVLLAEMMGWNVSGKIIDQFDKWFVIVQEQGDDWELSENVEHPFNLYDPANMALAWRVLNWAWGIPDDDPALVNLELHDWHEQIAWTVTYDSSPADAQRLWLDRILELAIEAGVIEEE